MADLALDVVEEILVRLDVKDLIRCKRVCKSWKSLISSPRFVTAHLKHTYNNDLNNHEFGHRRIGMGVTMDEHSWLDFNNLHVVGSCNGLVCISPKDAEFVVTNPSTKQQKKLPTPPSPRYSHQLLSSDWSEIRDGGCWGFGYDASTDDYKVIAGLRKKRRTHFYVLTLKSNTWKFIGQVKYECSNGSSGILCGGALHWFMCNDDREVIISLDLSTGELKETPQPADEEYESQVVNGLYEYKLGVIEECLCVFRNSPPFSSKKWVLKNNKWELYNDYCETTYDVAHEITKRTCVVDSQLTAIYGVDYGELVPSVGSYIRASIFVKSLVSPHPHDNTYEGRKRIAKQHGKEEGNIRKRKRYMRRKRSCKHKKPLVWI